MFRKGAVGDIRYLHVVSPRSHLEYLDSRCDQPLLPSLGRHLGFLYSAFLTLLWYPENFSSLQDIYAALFSGTGMKA